MAINYNDPYNQGIGTPNLRNMNVGNVGQMPVNNMQVAEVFNTPQSLMDIGAVEPGKVFGYNLTDQGKALEDFRNSAVNFRNAPANTANTPGAALGFMTDPARAGVSKYDSIRENKDFIQDAINKGFLSTPEDYENQKSIADPDDLEASLDNDFYNEYGYPKTADLSGTTGITTLSGNFGLLSENADISRSIDEQVTEYENEYMNRTGKVPPMFYGEKYRMKLQIEFLKKQEQKKTIPQGEKKRIEQEKIKTAQDNWKPTYNPASSHAEAQATGGDYHSGHQSTVGGQTTDWGPNSAMIARGGLAQYAPRGSYFDGGLASLWLR